MIGAHEHRFLGIDEARLLAQAVNETCIALHIAKEDTKARAIIAARVADLARSGATDIATLRDRVVREANTPI